MSPETVEVLRVVVPAFASVLVALIGARVVAKSEVRKIDATQLEQVVELAEKNAALERMVVEEREARERLGADLMAMRSWRDEYLHDEGRRRATAKDLAQRDRADTQKQLGEISTALALQGKTLDHVLQLAGGFHGLGRALHGRTTDGST